MSVSVIATVVSIVFFFEKRGKKEYSDYLLTPIILKLNSRYFYGLILAGIYLCIAFYFSHEINISSRGTAFSGLLDTIFMISTLPLFIVGFGGGSTFIMILVVLVETILIATITQFLIPKSWIKRIEN